MEVIKNFKTLPNQITLFRLLAVLPLYYFSFVGDKILFVILFMMAGLSDTLDGYVARKFNLCSKFGSDFDNLVDDAIILSGIVYLFFLRRDVYDQQILLLLGLVLLFVLNRVLINIKHKWAVRLHLYSGKVFERSYYLLFSIVIFTRSYTPFFYLLMFLGYYMVIEEILIYLKYDKLDIRIKSLFSEELN